MGKEAKDRKISLPPLPGRAGGKKPLTRAQKKFLLLMGLEGIVVLLLCIIVGWGGQVGDFFKRFSNPVVKEVDISGINSPYAILVQAAGGSEIASIEADVQVRPASLTKLMTALCALEKIPNLEKTCTLDWEVFEGLYEEGASQAGFEEGEVVRAIDLLYGMVLASGGECANALSIMAAGSVEAFVDVMNRKARSLGMANTHFQNAIGLDADDQYSTCRDLAVLMRVAMKNTTLKEVLMTRAYTSGSTNLHPEGLPIVSTLLGNMRYPDVTAGSIIGGKTGYTDEAGQCLASFARIGGHEYVLVTCGAPYSEYPLHIYDAQTIYERVGQACVEMGYEVDS